MTLILSGTDGLSDVDGSAATPAIRGTDANTGIFFPAADTIAFSEGGVEAMRIDSSGNVGIGTASPEAPLHVAKSASGGDGGYLYLDNPAASTLNNKAGIRFATSSGGSFASTPTGEITNVITDASSAASALTFGTFNGSSSGERMRIDSSGNVGIGTSSPSAKLDVNGNIAGGSVNVFGTSTPANGINNVTTNALGFFTNSTERMRIDSSGNVLVTSSASLGYGTGSGGSVTQATSKGTAVTINKANGRITMNNAALGAGGTAVFLVSNSLVASTDTVVLNVNDGIRGDLYNAWVWYVIGGGFYVALKNIGGSSYSDAVVLNFAVIKATTS